MNIKQCSETHVHGDHDWIGLKHIFRCLGNNTTTLTKEQKEWVLWLDQPQMYPAPTNIPVKSGWTQAVKVAAGVFKATNDPRVS